GLDWERKGNKNGAGDSAGSLLRTLSKIDERNRSKCLMKKSELSQTRIRKIRPPTFQHINRQIPPEPHTSMYVWHKYWSRKTWNVVNEHIEAYTKPQQVVFDPFAGSGVVAIEAARNKRRAIVCDLNPVASLITE